MNINVNSIVISKLIWAKSNSQFLIGYLDKVIRPLVSVLSKINTLKHAYVKIFKVFFKNVFSFYHKQIHPVTNYKAIKNKINKRRQHRTIFFLTKKQWKNKTRWNYSLLPSRRPLARSHFFNNFSLLELINSFSISLIFLIVILKLSKFNYLVFLALQK